MNDDGIAEIGGGRIHSITEEPDGDRRGATVDGQTMSIIVWRQRKDEEKARIFFSVSAKEILQNGWAPTFERLMERGEVADWIVVELLKLSTRGQRELRGGADEEINGLFE